ncbi:hypothetical protein [Desulfolutivibrio sulfoxidireducens]|uniref:hypothetical protein n=1 Tax=Desulfolutivibrio sulfoxidireducens TaxID=2773299 RepID=UPI00159DE9D3|nr:hypothetical protein [Desulfolutivibrio sulfoxidireducens]QLA18949.1 hypothetical protein GD604_03965 [Desulfolutivibrio sulfoxidireducens]
MNNEHNPGGEVGKEVVEGIETIAQFLKGLGDKIDVISEGLKAENPNSEGAAGLLDDMFGPIYDKWMDAEDLAKKALGLAAMVKVQAKGGISGPCVRLGIRRTVRGRTMPSLVEIDDIFHAAILPLQSFTRVLSDILPADVTCEPQAVGDVLEALLRDASDTFRTRVIQATPDPEESTT